MLKYVEPHELENVIAIYKSFLLLTSICFCPSFIVPLLHVDIPINNIVAVCQDSVFQRLVM